MKILLLSSESDLPETHLFLGLYGLGHELHVIQKPGSRRIDTFSAQGIRVYQHEASSRFSIKSYKFLKSLFEKERYDICHHTNARLLTAALFASKNIPTMKHIAYRGTVGHLSWWDPASRFSYLHPRVDAISCVSHAVEEYLKSLGVSYEKLFTIYKGHHLDWYANKTPTPERKHFSLPEESFVISCVANVRPVKGVDVLIKAFSMLPESLAARLLLIGDMKNKETMLKDLSAQQKEKVVITGFLPDAYQYVTLSDCFVMPSREREGLPKALIEAMIQGVPCIGSNVGGIPELIDDAHSGLLVEPSNAIALKQKLQQMCSYSPSERKEFGLKAKEKILNNFTVEKTIKETLEMYEKILARG